MQAGVMSRVISVTAEDLVTLPIRLAQLSRAPGRSHVSRSLRIFSREIVSTICEDVQLSVLLVLVLSSFQFSVFQEVGGAEWRSCA